MSKSLYADACDEKLEYILRLAEVRLAAQATMGVAADQRAMTFASFLAAVEGAVITGLVAIAPKHGVPPALVVMVVGFAVASVLALIAAQPVDWDIVGSRPSDWLEDIEDRTSLKRGKAAMAQHMDEMIADNGATMKTNASLVRSAIFIVITTLLLAGVCAVPIGSIS